MDMKPEFQCYALWSKGSNAVFGGTPGQLTFDEQFDYALIDTDGDFELKKLAAFTTRDALAQTEETRQLPTGIMFNIRDNATGRTLFSRFADSGEIFGDGRVPFVLPTSHFFKRGSQAQVLYAPASQQGPDFQTSTIFFIMIGAKHFKESR